MPDQKLTMQQQRKGTEDYFNQGSGWDDLKKKFSGLLSDPSAVADDAPSSEARSNLAKKMADMKNNMGQDNGQ